MEGHKMSHSLFIPKQLLVLTNLGKACLIGMIVTMKLPRQLLGYSFTHHLLGG